METNPIFQKFSERLTAIRKEFEQHQIDLSERIKRYYDLMNDIKSKNDEAKELGLDLREFGVYAISQEFIETSNIADLVMFVKDLCQKLNRILDEGWQNSSKREEFLKGAKQVIQETVLKDYRDRFTVTDFPKFLNRLIDIVLKRF